MLIGYMRVSTDNDRQSTDLQRDALVAAGVDARHLFEDRASGAWPKRSILFSPVMCWWCGSGVPLSMEQICTISPAVGGGFTKYFRGNPC